jgi:hypothetical protein
MNGACIPATSKLNEPLLAIGAVNSLAGVDESLRYAVPTSGKPAAATPDTVLVAAVGVEGVEENPPPEPPLPQPASIRLIADKHMTIKPVNFFFIFSPFLRIRFSAQPWFINIKWVGLYYPVRNVFASSVIRPNFNYLLPIVYLLFLIFYGIILRLPDFAHKKAGAEYLV